MSSTKTTWARRSCSETNSTRRSKRCSSTAACWPTFAVLQRVSLPHGGPETTTIPKGAHGAPRRPSLRRRLSNEVAAGRCADDRSHRGHRVRHAVPARAQVLQRGAQADEVGADRHAVQSRQQRGARWSTSGAKSVGIVTWKFVGATIDGLNMALPHRHRALGDPPSQSTTPTRSRRAGGCRGLWASRYTKPRTDDIRRLCVPSYRA